MSSVTIPKTEIKNEERFWQRKVAIRDAQISYQETVRSELNNQQEIPGGMSIEVKSDKWVESGLE